MNDRFAPGPRRPGPVVPGPPRPGFVPAPPRPGFVPPPRALAAPQPASPARFPLRAKIVGGLVAASVLVGGGAAMASGGGTTTAAVAPVSNSSSSSSSSAPAAECSPSALLAQLQAHADRADAWAGVFGLSRTDVPGFVQGFRATTLSSDTAVVDHVWSGTTYVPSDVTLPRGTEVLVDESGTPTVKCADYDPLTRYVGSGSPRVVVQPVYVGWDDEHWWSGWFGGWGDQRPSDPSGGGGSTDPWGGGGGGTTPEPDPTLTDPGPINPNPGPLNPNPGPLNPEPDPVGPSPVSTGGAGGTGGGTGGGGDDDGGFVPPR